MSRNFELMTQLEIEAGVTDKPKSAAADRAAAMARCPHPFEPMPAMPAERRCCGSSSAYSCRPTEVPHGRSFSAAWTKRMAAVLSAPGLDGLSPPTVRGQFAWSTPMCVHRASRVCLAVEGTNPFSGPSAPLREQCVKIGGNLWLAGPNILADNSRVLLPPDQLKERLAQLRDEFEYMLIDAPGTSVCGDAQLLGLVADAAILVIEANSTRRLTARKAKETLDAAGVRLLGTVLHNRSFPIPEGLYKRL